MRRLRFPIPLSILLFLALTAVGAYYVRKGMLERAIVNAMAIDDERAVKDLLNSWPCPVGARQEDGWSVIAWAAWADHVEIVRLSLEKGVSVNGRDRHEGTPLHRAVVGRSTESVKLLLARGADANARNVFGDTPLAQARRGMESLSPDAKDARLPDIIAILLKHGAKE